MSISVTMAYYNRPKLLQNTLWSYYHLHKNIVEYEFIIVDDISDEELSAVKAVEEFLPYMDIKVITLTGPKVSSNPARAINVGVINASYDTVVITNPECMPITAVLEEIKDRIYLLDKPFLVVPCYAVHEDDQKLINKLSSKDGFTNMVKKIVHIVDKPMSYEGGGYWYEHPYYIPRYYYFMAAMHKKDFIEIGGIDEDFMGGVAFEDDDFKRRLIANSFTMEHLENSLCFHQNHYAKNMKHPAGNPGWNINSALYLDKKKTNKRVANEGKDWT